MDLTCHSHRGSFFLSGANFVAKSCLSLSLYNACRLYRIWVGSVTPPFSLVERTATYNEKNVCTTLCMTLIYTVARIYAFRVCGHHNCSRKEDREKFKMHNIFPLDFHAA